MSKEAETKTPEIVDFSTLNHFKGEKSQAFIHAFNGVIPDDAVLLLKQKEVHIIDASTIEGWKQELKTHKETFANNEKGYLQTIAAYKSDLEAVTQPLVALRPAFLGIIDHFRSYKENPGKEGREWALVRRVLNGLY